MYKEYIVKSNSFEKNLVHSFWKINTSTSIWRNQNCMGRAFPPLFLWQCPIQKTLSLKHQTNGSSQSDQGCFLIPLLLFSGIGWAVVLIAFYTDFFYNVVIAWSIHFLFSSFTSELPWATCGHEWNTEYCYEGKPSVASGNGSESNSTLEGTTLSNLVSTLVTDVNSTNSTNVTEEARKISPAEEYFK